MNQTKTILTITGSDGTGGSGVQADIRFIAELGATASSAVTSITVQNTLGIQEFYDLPAAVVSQQIEAIINDLQPQVVKIGLLRNVEVAEAVVAVLRRYMSRQVVYAPVLYSAKGEQLMPVETYTAIRHLVEPICTIVLDPSDSRWHGYSSQLSSAVAVFLSRGDSVNEALLHARTYLKQLPEGYALTTGRSSELYNKFLVAVERYCHRYSDVAFYAEQLNVSPRYLGQVTRSVGGRSPKVIIDEYITSEIVSLLTTTDKPLKEIARLVGFSSQAHLSRYFRKQKGISPRDYKLNHTKWQTTDKT